MYSRRKPNQTFSRSNQLKTKEPRRKPRSLELKSLQLTKIVSTYTQVNTIQNIDIKRKKQLSQIYGTNCPRFTIISQYMEVQDKSFKSKSIQQ